MNEKKLKTWSKRGDTGQVSWERDLPIHRGERNLLKRAQEKQEYFPQIRELGRGRWAIADYRNEDKLCYMSRHREFCVGVGFC